MHILSIASIEKKTEIENLLLLLIRYLSKIKYFPSSHDMFEAYLVLIQI